MVAAFFNEKKDGAQWREDQNGHQKDKAMEKAKLLEKRWS